MPPDTPPGFTNTPLLDFARAEVREEMQDALARIRAAFGGTYPLVIGGKTVYAEDEAETGWITSHNPSRPWEVVGRVPRARPEHAIQAVDAARQAFAGWSRRRVEDRSRALEKAADFIQQRRYEYTAWVVFEAGKPWREADGDVAEAIDFLRYYAAEMRDLDRPVVLQPLPGETNEYEYRPLGPGVVIAPWNFPMAIITGMTAAALVAGNPVVMKPAEQTPVCAWWIFHALVEGGEIPAGVVNFLPGVGEEIGEPLVTSPGVAFIAFTGSVPVGLRINELAARVHPDKTGVTRVVAEMGGKNAIIVDTSADLDAAVSGVLRSAFHYAGQKCSAASRVLVPEEIYAPFLARLREAAASLSVGPADDPGTQVGPVIDRESVERIRSYGARLLPNPELPPEGHSDRSSQYVSPTIVEAFDYREAVCQEEIFGPVVAVLKVRDFDHALRMANATRYALTGGLYTRTPSHVERARREFECGNLYVNRPITGAVVGRQPFGGYKMSGIGSKAGGPDYLKQFLVPRTFTENTLRHGFAPLAPQDIETGRH